MRGIRFHDYIAPISFGILFFFFKNILEIPIFIRFLWYGCEVLQNITYAITLREPITISALN